MFTRELSPLFAKLALLALVGLIFYGNVPAEDVINLVVVFIALRLAFIGAEAAIHPMSGEQWSVREATIVRQYSQASAAECQALALAFDLPANATAADLSRIEIALARSRYVVPRGRWELLAEALGLFAFGILLPLDVGLLTQPLFSFSRPLEMAGAVVLAGSLALYSLPLFRWLIFRESTARSLWWSLPFVPALLVLAVSVIFHHPYLNPFNPDHHRLAADRIIALNQTGNTVVAASHVDWIFRYAHDLEARGEKEAAATYYRAGLGLDASRRDAHDRLIALEPPAPTPATARSVGPFAPLWPEDTELPSVPLRKLDSSIGDIRTFTIVLVPVGKVPGILLDAVGYAIRNELGLPVAAISDSLPLPEASRMHGLAVGNQWNVEAIARAFAAAYPSLPAAPVKYLLLTDEDIYSDGSNFVFSSAHPWGAIVSAARFIAMDPHDYQILHRTAKQSLCAILKSFGVPASPDRECVTSYVRSMDEFDTKGNRPNPQTLALFRKALADAEQTRPQPDEEDPLQSLHNQLQNLP